MDNNKIAYSEMEDMVNKFFNAEFTQLLPNNVECIVKNNLSLREMMTFVNDVVSSCFSIDTDEYLPEIKEFSIRCSMIESYTNIELPEELSKKYELVYSGVIQYIIEHIDKDQFKSMLRAIDQKIKYKIQTDSSALHNKMNKIVDELEEMSKNFEKIFGSIDSDTINKIATSIVNGDFDMDKLVSSYVGVKHTEDKQSEPEKVE